MPYSLLQNLLRRKDTTASAIREVVLDHILNSLRENGAGTCSAFIPSLYPLQAVGAAPFNDPSHRRFCSGAASTYPSVLVRDRRRLPHAEHSPRPWLPTGRWSCHRADSSNRRLPTTVLSHCPGGGNSAHTCYCLARLLRPG